MAQVVGPATGDIPHHGTLLSETGLLDSLLEKVGKSLSNILLSIGVDIDEIKDKIFPEPSEV
jgi:hypothetical protein